MQPILSVQNLSKSFNGFTAVDSISFAVQKQQIFAFLGPNGAGKTTTIRMLTTLLPPTSGSMAVAGFDPVHQQAEVRRNVGIVFQDPSLDDELTAWENMDFHGVLYQVPVETRRQRIESLLRFVGLWDRQHDFVKNFSGGMKRRLELARSLVHHPHILFLDEPTLGLDPQTRNSIWQYLRHLVAEEGMTILFTTHHMEEAEKMADAVAIIDHGKIARQGTAAELKKETNSLSLEEAFLKLTGHGIREEEGSALERLRTQKRMWGR